MTLEGRRVVKALIGERKNRTFDVRIVISGVYAENDRIDEFKEECIKQLMLYREKLQNDIKSALRLLRECDDAFGGLE